MTAMIIIKGFFLFLALILSGALLEDVIENIIHCNKMDKNIYDAQQSTGLIKIVNVRLFITVTIIWTIFYILSQQ